MLMLQSRSFNEANLLAGRAVGSKWYESADCEKLASPSSDTKDFEEKADLLMRKEIKEYEQSKLALLLHHCGVYFLHFLIDFFILISYCLISEFTSLK